MEREAIPNASFSNICSQTFGLAIGQTYIIRYTITDQTNGSLTLTTDTFFLGTSPVINKEKTDYIESVLHKFIDQL